MTDNFAAFQLPDGRSAFVRVAAVVGVYDEPSKEAWAWQPVTPENVHTEYTRDGRGNLWAPAAELPTPTSMIVFGMTSMQVPYTAEAAMRIIGEVE